MDNRTKAKLHMLKRKVGAKSDTQLIYAICLLVYEFKLFEELKERLK